MCSRKYHSGWGYWWVPLAFFGLIAFSKVGFPILIGLIMLAMASKACGHNWQQHNDYPQKAKREEKSKRSGIVTADGTRLEVIEDDGPTYL